MLKSQFAQLFSFHAFVKKDGKLEQVSLAFVVMSRRRRKDYIHVLRAVISILPRRSHVQSIVADFEVAFWQAVKKVLPGVTQRGCAFHFTQGVWRNIQAVGLQVAYTKDETVNRICRKTIALPFLPADCISDAFLELEASGNDIVQVATHLQYVRRQWIDSTVWPPSTWSVFRQPIRTNNDVEGWHRRLNVRANQGALNLYQLLQLLHSEALLVNLNIRLMSENGTSRYQRKVYSKLHTRINTYWDEYSAGTRSASSLLGACSRACKHL